MRAAERPPNVVLLFADDLGYGELGCQGNPEIPTPHIDSIATNGVRFTQGYVTAAFCSASRAGLMTGRYQTRFGYEFNPGGAHNEDPDAGLPPSEKTIADMLAGAGYVNGLVGKWHLGGTAKYHPFRRGFDEFFGFLHEGHYFVPPPYRGTTTWLRRKVLPGGGKGRWTSRDGRTIYSTHLGNEPDYDADNPIYRGGQPIVEEKYLTDAFTREAVDFIDRNTDRPFFLYLAYNAVHSPMQATDKYMKHFAEIKDIQRRIFAGMLSNMDNSVGSVLEKLRKERLEENTLVFFISDNGGPTAELTSSNLPLRGGKGTVYEGGIRVPFMIRWDGHVPAGSVNETQVAPIDWYPTFLALAGVDAPGGHILDGENLLPLFSDPAATLSPRSLFWHFPCYTQASTPMGTWRSKPCSVIRSGDWKLHYYYEDERYELYDLVADIGEANNPVSYTHLTLPTNREV